jgi:hypothetical protein
VRRHRLESCNGTLRPGGETTLRRRQKQLGGGRRGTRDAACWQPKHPEWGLTTKCGMEGAVVRCELSKRVVVNSCRTRSGEGNGTQVHDSNASEETNGGTAPAMGIAEQKQMAAWLRWD